MTSTSSASRPQAAAQTPRASGSGPWWRYPLMWMVVGGPTVVVVAGIVTAWIAVRSPDPVVDADYYRHGLEINRSLAARRRRSAR